MLLRKTPLLLLFLTICFASCKKGTVVRPENKGKDLVLTPLDQQKVTADNAFTLKLFKTLAVANASGANLFVSPLSVSLALGMASNGAAGQTLIAFKNTLNFSGLTQDQVNSYYNNLITNLPQLDPNTTLDIANSIWYKKGFDVLPSFLQVNSNSFRAKIQALDFSDPASVKTINNWVSDQTNGNIPTIINQIPDNAVMYLINAIYFKSAWKEKFDATQTKPLPFFLTDNSQVQASFMSNGELDFKRFDNSEASIFELPYSNSKYSMVIILPATGTTIQQLIPNIDSAKWVTWMTSLQATKGPLKLPKFKFSYSTSLNSALTILGLGNAFSDSADFSKISAAAHLSITDVEHKAFVEVDENGTTAAAVTSVGVGATAAPMPPPSIIDHPFIFAIREMSSGLIIFAGTVNNPTLPGE